MYVVYFHSSPLHNTDTRKLALKCQTSEIVCNKIKCFIFPTVFVGLAVVYVCAQLSVFYSLTVRVRFYAFKAK